MKKHKGRPALPYQECSLEQPCQAHFCQIHKDEVSLTAAARRFLLAGAMNGDNLMLVTSRSRGATILSWLTAAGLDVSRLQKAQKLFLHDTRNVLASILKSGKPDWHAYKALASEAVDTATWQGEKKLRLYGDAVSDLWWGGNHEGAVCLEDFWIRFRREHDYAMDLFCGYMIDVFLPSSYSSHLPHLGRTHNLVMPGKDDLMLAGALDHASHEILGITPTRAAMESSTPDKPWRDRLPSALRAGLWLHENHPSRIDRVLDRARSIYAA